MKRQTRGFTLIELMVVVVIVAILASVAVPSYREYVRRSDRAAARTALLENAQFMERNRTVSNSYAMNPAGLPLDSTMLPVQAAPKDGTPKYTITLVAAELNATAFVLQAEPLAGSPMEGDDCGSYTLNEQGFKNVVGATETVERCWAR